jgi:hypothetical protein
MLKESDMKTKLLAPLLASILALTQTPFTTAQANDPTTTKTDAIAQDWQGLRDLKPGKKILIEFKPGVSYPVEGKFASVEGDRLYLSGEYPTSFEQRDIQRVYRLKGRWSRGKAARIGAGIGLVVGTFIGAGVGIRAEGQPGHIPSEADTAPAFAGFFIGGLVGAGLGALGGGKRKGELLYEAK